MYYNPETKETLDAQSLRNRLNVSFPDGRKQVRNWHFVDQKSMLPKLKKSQIPVRDGIVEKDGTFFQAYRTADVSESRTDAERIALLEAALADLANLVSSIGGSQADARKMNGEPSGE